MKTRTNKIYAASYVIIRKDHRVLLMRRYNTGYQDGKYTLPAGHVDEREFPSNAAVRETLEETGIKVNKLINVHMMYRIVENGRTYVDYYYEAEDWVGDPRVIEPNKCNKVDWFKVDDLPENTLSHVVIALNNIVKGIHFSEIKHKLKE